MKHLRKEVKHHLNHGSSFESVRAHMQHKGYSRRMINKAILAEVSGKGIFFIAAMILVIVVGLVLIFVLTGKESTDLVVNQDGFSVINTELFTNGEVHADDINQYFNLAGEDKKISLEGNYFGRIFEGGYFEQIVDENGLTIEGEVKLRITKRMVPYDSVPDAFAFEMVENDKPVIYIFLDSDWKAKLPDTTIVGSGKQKFEFSNEITRGIYLQKYADDYDRFASGFTIYPIIVGNVTSYEKYKGVSFSII